MSRNGPSDTGSPVASPLVVDAVCHSRKGKLDSKSFDDAELERLTRGFELKFGKVERRRLRSKQVKAPALSAEALFERAWLASPLPGFELVREYKFHPTRGWPFDMAWPAVKVAVELQGQGKHQRVLGERNDHEKGREAVLLGWRVLYWQSMQVAKGAPEMIEFVKRVLSQPAR